MRRPFLLKIALFFIVLLSISFFSISAQEKIPTPKSVIGFSIGEDYKLTDWNKVVEYFKLLDSASDRVLLQELGTTTMGRPFILAVISAPENLANLDIYKSIQQKLADPRKIGNQEAKDLITQGKTIVLITCTIHSTEIASLYLQ